MPSPVTDIADPAAAGVSTDHVLVVTDREMGVRAGLMVPFREATVLQLGQQDEVRVEGPFDTAVIDVQSLDAPTLDRVLASLRPGARIVAVLSADSGSPFDAGLFGAAGLAWHGVAALDRRLCAVVEVVAARSGADSGPAMGADSGPAESTMGNLRAAVAGYELGAAASAQTITDLRNQLSQLQASMITLAEIRQRSERALVDELAIALRDLEFERAIHQGWRVLPTLLRRNIIGRAVIRVLRPLVRAVRTIRRGQVPGHTHYRRIANRIRGIDEDA
jgi:hypothetical protein